MISDLVNYARENEVTVYSMAEYNQVDEKWTCEQIVPASKCNDIYSISKNFTATAIGMLCDSGELSLDTTIYSLFANDYPVECREEWKNVTIEHVLTQTTGIGRGFLDIDSDDISLYPSQDYLKIVLSEELPYVPGTRMVYSDSNFYLLSRVVYRVSGQYLQDFLRERLFLPLGFQGYAWATCPMGHAMGGTGLFLRAVDIAKFGVLYLQNGEWNHKSILSKTWVEEATAPKVISSDGANYYGYSFWVPGKKNYYFGGGVYGQKVMIIPSLGRVIAWTARDKSNKMKEHFDKLMDA